jgi:Na+/H+ antiporter NhaD/arsenite permease-like protein
MLQGPLANTRLAIPAGAVFMGANIYIGNALNFMVKSIAEQEGIPLPSSFGYITWSTVLLPPLFGPATHLFFA